ncbi:MAG: hypothetical protein JEZ09_11545 [Salinivirgaceae bacterium]|nr:hypothetical protein [Salinivirgaceae bacterium]
MNTKFKNNSLLIASIILCGIVFLITLAYLQKSLKQESHSTSMEIVDAYGREYKNIIEKGLTEVLESNRTLVSVFEGHHNFDYKTLEPIYDNVLQNFMETYPEYLSVCLYWELKALDKNYNKLNGRVRNISCRIMDELFSVKQIVDTTNDIIINDYYTTRDLNEETIWEPYYDAVTPGLEGVLMSTVVVPISVDGVCEGMVGIDISLEHFAAYTKLIKPFSNTRAYIIANNQMIVGHSNEELVGEQFLTSLKVDTLVFKDALAKTSSNKGSKFTYINADDNEEYFVSFKPIKVGNISKNWTLGIEVPAKELNVASNNILRNALLIGLIGLLIAGLAVIFVALRLKE